MKNHEKVFFSPLIKLIVVLIVVAAAFYFFEKHKSQIAPNVVPQENDYLNIPELGIKIKLTNDIMDLTYSLCSRRDFGKIYPNCVQFSTKSLAAASNEQCKLRTVYSSSEDPRIATTPGDIGVDTVNVRHVGNVYLYLPYNQAFDCGDGDLFEIQHKALVEAINIAKPLK